MALIIGLISIVVFSIVANYINRQRKVRLGGQLLSCPIIKISYSNKGGNSGHVEIDGQILRVSSLDSKWKVGDSIWVRYLKGETLVVQEKFGNGHFVLLFTLDSILLVLGVLLVYAGIAGKGRLKKAENRIIKNRKGTSKRQ
ncbi:MAG: hypothetical protein HOP30_13265 [Cyclobacteriaceae bacterium]|nr:hypothetical protein [Cyclobacteriaceae bacterium]